jgi:hypothetical protein
VRHRPDDPNVVRFEVTAFRERILPVVLLIMGIVFAGIGTVTGKTLGTRLATPGAR